MDPELVPLDWPALPELPPLLDERTLPGTTEAGLKLGCGGSGGGVNAGSAVPVATGGGLNGCAVALSPVGSGASVGAARGGVAAPSQPSSARSAAAIPTIGASRRTVLDTSPPFPVPA